MGAPKKCLFGRALNLSRKSTSQEQPNSLQFSASKCGTDKNHSLMQSLQLNDTNKENCPQQSTHSNAGTCTHPMQTHQVLLDISNWKKDTVNNGDIMIGPQGEALLPKKVFETVTKRITDLSKRKLSSQISGVTSSKLKLKSSKACMF